MVKKALDSTEGFTFVLTGAKALLGHVELNLVKSYYPWCQEDCETAPTSWRLSRYL